MAVGNKRPSEEPIIVLDSDSTEQEEPQLNVHKFTTMANDTEENTNNTEAQSIENAQIEGSAMVERNELGEASPNTQEEGADISTPTTTERAQDAQQSEEVPTNISDMERPTTTEQGKTYTLTRP